MAGTPENAAPKRLQFRHVVTRSLAILMGIGIGFPVLYALFVPEDRLETERFAMPKDTTYRVFVVDWGYHTSLMVEQPRGWELGPAGEEAAPFLEYAWGDRSFYYASDFRIHKVAATLVAPTASVLYLDGHPDPPHLSGADAVLQATVDASTIQKLLHALEHSVQRTATGKRQPALQPVAGYRGRFYPAHGDYLWNRNCNWWTVARLADVGLSARPMGVVFPSQVLRRVRGFADGG